MTIPTLEYRGYELRAHARKLAPPFGDLLAPGPRRFTSIVRIDTRPPTSALATRYTTLRHDDAPQTEQAALDPAIEFGKAIVDGKIAPPAL